MVNPPNTDLRFGSPPNVQPVYALNTPVNTDLRFRNPNVMPVYIENASRSVFNVVSYGAVGDGVTDDGPALRAAADACRLASGGIFYLPAPPVAYNVVPVLGGSTGAMLAGIFLGAKTTMLGDGRGATLIQLAPSSPNHAYILHNYNLAGGDTDIFLHGFTVDGNAANQLATIDAQYGCRFFRARRIHLHEVDFTNVYGTVAGGNGPNGTAGEGFHQQFDNCADVSLIQCDAYATAASTSTGFASNQSTNISRIACTVYGMGHGQGFTDWTSQNIHHAGCFSYLNGRNGFNLELSGNARYDGCVSGGVATSAGAYPFTNGQNLGNTGAGFSCSQSHEVYYNDCDSSGNTQQGLTVVGVGVANVRWAAGRIANNGNSGVNLDTNANNGGFRFTSAPILGGNVPQDIYTAGTPATLNGVTGKLGAVPAFPASGVAWVSAFPFPVHALVSGGAITAITADGQALPAFLNSGGYILLRSGASVTFTYTGTPGWTFWSLLA